MPTMNDNQSNQLLQNIQNLKIGGFTEVVSSTVVMSVAGAYASGDYMGTSTTPQYFSDVVRGAKTGIIKSITITDKIATANVGMELWLYSSTFTAPTDNAAWTITDAENLTCVGVISLATTNWFASAANQNYFDGNLCIPLKLTGNLYYALVARGVTPAFTSLDLTISLGILQD